MLRRVPLRLAVPLRRTALGALLQQQIHTAGKGVPFAEFMDQAMRHPEHGYFTTKAKVIGSDADFITAPELLPEFGWCVGRWLAEAAVKVFNGDPHGWDGEAFDGPGGEVSLVEFGPGTGRLMAQLLMFLKYEVGVHCLAKIHLRMIEVSPVMIAQQKEMLRPFLPHLGSIQWRGDVHAGFESLSDAAPTFIVSNEYFDVLPVHILNCRGGGVWHEQVVSCTKPATAACPSSNPDPTFFLRENAAPAGADLTDLMLARKDAGEAGDRMELCPQAVRDMNLMASRIEKTGGMVLALDYGKDVPSENTLQGMWRQETCSPLLNPGEIDISWHVDFDLLRQHVQRVAPSLAFTSAHTQQEFLARMGFEQFVALRRRQAEADGAPLPSHLERRYELLMDPHQMGGHHRAVALCSKELYPPPGFGRVV
eukprot:TRINITY_DN25912_c0_g1_i1.p1 TRINITY_DN25912_c0_g1~~TRINITY_DN25912_c0_g1_i1.p1  ORF type:complete len:423 (+),score=165.96 TRINITY_DN25912_c0_g1_i1:49-1317(+)